MVAWPYQTAEKQRNCPSERHREPKITHRGTATDLYLERKVWLSGELGEAPVWHTAMAM